MVGGSVLLNLIHFENFDHVSVQSSYINVPTLLDVSVTMYGNQ